MLKDILLSLIISFLVSSFLLPEIIKVALRYDISDVPDERKIHVRKIPRFGGLAIFFGFMISVLLVTTYSEFRDIHLISYIIGSLLVVVAVGMRDDFLALRPLWKLVGQVLACVMVMFLAKVKLTSLYGFLGVYEINDFASYIITLFILIVITNAYNLIDGIDGLAGTLAILIFGFYGFWFAFLGSSYVSVLCFSIVGASLAFLRYNYSPAQIFMGDTGSLLLGFMAAVLTILFLQQNYLLIESNVFKINTPVALVCAILAYPLFDTLRVFVVRIFQGRSPFSPDRNHLHHHLLNVGFSHLNATFVILAVELVLVAFVFIVQAFRMDDTLLVGLILLMCLSFALFLLSTSVEKQAKTAD
ncbi:MAG: undecaprenyl/decaprenyl-phosphate alpha-N-acetylglucosaminyl 1-phosphate transferase [Cytophagales bacterium]|nr:MAG: undecaprenyl/decaprenyl-phosphate alpha-N-acetylglucosaminyl 1-phosphate transferase [Cytophagales bacterium]TAF61664.1 MAG: undecaprenyl/decaprenyl-phosphate alpha-N-acetylglucosaminyl 1-phosphate transferase [Cytophagales bacterium]